ncbi:extensin family protein [Tabrizicola sp. BL-A-41-H6]|uniref:extensin-like domain-containing protein n=1 Tax=Tabrizicola sp. BL-A-41-H6 TaxID=3421107 RepID=UPI003D66FA40
MRGAVAALILFGATAVAAEPVDRSPRPPPNPIYTGVASVAEAVPDAAAPAEAPVDALARSPRPKPRPGSLVAKVAAAEGAGAEQGLDLTATAVVPEPAEPPLSKREERRKKREAASLAGSVCGVAAIKGEEIAPIKSKVKGCGVPEAVRVTSVSGVRLSQGATIDCDTARALNTWVSQVLQPAYRDRVVELRIAAHYICRSRNNIRGAKISEHGKGKAIDISAFVLSNGRAEVVAGGFDRTMRKVHKGACGIFKTTLGPGSDGFHEDHLHFDTSDRSGGAYCR